MRVLRIGGIARLELGDIGLFLLHQIVKQPRRAPDHQRQNARSLRIERARMTNLRAPAQLAPDADNHIA